MYYKNTLVDYQKRWIYHMDHYNQSSGVNGCKGNLTSFVKINMRSMKHWVNFRHQWQLRNNIQRLFQQFNPSHASCCLLSRPIQPTSFSSLPSPSHPNLFLCSHLTPPDTILPNSTVQPPCSTAVYNYLLPLFTFLPTSPWLVFPLLFCCPTYWHYLCRGTAPAVPAAWLQNTSWFRALQRGIFLICF